MKMLTDLPAAPTQYPSVGPRWQESAKRYAMLSGSWYQHLREEFVRWFPNEQTQMQIGRVDITKNTAQAVISQLSTLYDVAPIVQHEDTDAARAMSAICDEAGIWQLHREKARCVSLSGRMARSVSGKCQHICCMQSRSQTTQINQWRSMSTVSEL